MSPSSAIRLLELLYDEITDPVSEYGRVATWAVRARVAMESALGKESTLAAEFATATRDLSLPAPSLAHDWDVHAFRERFSTAQGILRAAIDALSAVSPGDEDGRENRTYWSERQGRGRRTPVTFAQFRNLMFQYWDSAIDLLLVEEFGQWCGDAPGDWRSGRSGYTVEQSLLMELHLGDVWPYREHVDAFNEDALLDVVEFFYDRVSKPTGGEGHSFFNHIHWDEFDREAGRREYRTATNRILARHDPPLVLEPTGEIRLMPDLGVDSLISAEVPRGIEPALADRIRAATESYRGARTNDQLRHAVRDIADALEFVRKELPPILKGEDDKTLFLTFNRFAIRHFDRRQQTDYEAGPVLRWLFYVGLATIHLHVRYARSPGPSESAP